MSAVKGQPGTKPQSLPKKPEVRAAEVVAESPKVDMFAAPSQEEMNLFEAPSQEELSAAQEPSSFESPGYTEALPFLGGLGGAAAGAAIGAPFAGVGAIPGAFIGGVIGAGVGAAGFQGWRDIIETQILGKPQSSAMDVTGDMAAKGGREALDQAVGLGIGKAAGAVAKAIPNKLYEPIAEYGNKLIKGLRDQVETPVMKLIASKVTPMNSEAAGDAAKELFKRDIQKKYGPFIQAYADLDAVAKAVPLRDEARVKFNHELREFAAEFSGDNNKIIRKFTDDITASNSGKHLDDVIRQIEDARQVAYKTGASNQAQVLKELKARANNFLDGETTRLATRIQAGKATPEEINFVKTIAQQRGIQDPDINKYAKSLANDFMKSKDKVRGEYHQFKLHLEDVAEQTRVRPSKSGPMAFIEDINDVPSEKLIEKMFDPKNAAALRKMKEVTPEVYDVVAKSKVKEILRKSSPTGEVDIRAFQKEIAKLPDSTKSLLFSTDDLKAIHNAVNDPKLKKLEALERIGNNMITKWIGDVAKVSGVIAEEAGKTAAKYPKASAAARQVVGKGTVGATQYILRPRDADQD